MGATISAGLASAWTGNRGSMLSGPPSRPPMKCAGESKGTLGGLGSPIWCTIGCFPVTKGLSGGA